MVTDITPPSGAPHPLPPGDQIPQVPGQYVLTVDNLDEDQDLNHLTLFTPIQGKGKAVVLEPWQNGAVSFPAAPSRIGLVAATIEPSADIGDPPFNDPTFGGQTVTPLYNAIFENSGRRNGLYVGIVTETQIGAMVGNDIVFTGNQPDIVASCSYRDADQGNPIPSECSGADNVNTSVTRVDCGSQIAIGEGDAAILCATSSITTTSIVSLPNGFTERLNASDLGQTFNLCARDAASDPEPQYPPERSLNPESYPEISRPNYLQSEELPFFGTQIKRVSDDAVFGDNDVYHDYPKRSNWNSDGTLYKIRSWIIDDATDQIIFRWTEDPGISLGVNRWSNADPDIIYYIPTSGSDEHEFRKFNVQTRQTSLLHDFSNDGYGDVTFGRWEGNPSDNDFWVAITARPSGTDDMDIIVFDLRSNLIRATQRFAGKYDDSQFNSVSVSRSGDLVLVWDHSPGQPNHVIKKYDLDLNFIGDLDSEYNMHGDLCFDQNGDEVYTSRFIGGRIRSLRISDGFSRIEMSRETMGSSSDGFYCSGRAIQRPGWAYISQRGDRHECYALKLDGSETVQRFAHHHSDSWDVNRNSLYGTPNHDGTRVLIRSDWNFSENDGISYSYIAEMPQNGAPLSSEVLTPFINWANGGYVKIIYSATINAAVNTLTVHDLTEQDDLTSPILQSATPTQKPLKLNPWREGVINIFAATARVAFCILYAKNDTVNVEPFGTVLWDGQPVETLFDGAADSSVTEGNSRMFVGYVRGETIQAIQNPVITTDGAQPDNIITGSYSFVDQQLPLSDNCENSLSEAADTIACSRHMTADPLLPYFIVAHNHQPNSTPDSIPPGFFTELNVNTADQTLTIAERPGGDLYTNVPFISWDNSFDRSMAVSIILRGTQLLTTEFILDNPDSTEFGAGWEDVL